MKVSFNPVNNMYKQPTFSSKLTDYEESRKKAKEDKIITAKTKKVVSECATVAIGATIVYFAMKHNFKINGIKSAQKKVSELAKTPRPNWIVDPGNINILPL